MNQYTLKYRNARTKELDMIRVNAKNSLRAFTVADLKLKGFGIKWDQGSLCVVEKNQSI